MYFDSSCTLGVPIGVQSTCFCLILAMQQQKPFCTAYHVLRHKGHNVLCCAAVGGIYNMPLHCYMPFGACSYIHTIII